MNLFKKGNITNEKPKTTKVSAPVTFPQAPKKAATGAVTPTGASVLIDLEKRARTVTVCLEKKNVSSLVAEVKLVLDSTGSMGRMYSSGAVQKAIERLVPLAMQFDDNGEMEVYTFAQNCIERPTITKDNLAGYTGRELRGCVGGGTYYAPAIKAIIDEAKAGNLQYPAFVMFVTDGENFDQKETEKMLREASKYDIYFQFVGIGQERFSFLKSLDDLSGRKFDNAGFIAVKDMDRMTDEKLYDAIIDEFVDAYKAGVFSTGNLKTK